MVIMLAKQRIRANLTISEGWNSMPIFSQRVAPLCSTPKGITAASNNSDTTIRGRAK